MWKDIFETKFKIFKKGFLGGLATGGIFLFTGDFTGYHLIDIFLVFMLKCIATFSLAFATGCAGVWAEDFAKEVKIRFKKLFNKKQKDENKNNDQEKAA